MVVCPQPLAGLEVVGQHLSVLGAAKEHAVPVGGATVDPQNARRDVLVGAPVLGAGRRIEREDVELGGADQRPVHHDQAGFEDGVDPGVVGAEDLDLPGVRGGDLGQRRVAVRRQGPVVARPVRVRRRRLRRSGRGRRLNRCTAPMVGVRLRRQRALRRVEAPVEVERHSAILGHLRREHLVDDEPRSRAEHDQDNDGHQNSSHQNLPAFRRAIDMAARRWPRLAIAYGRRSFRSLPHADDVAVGPLTP